MCTSNYKKFIMSVVCIIGAVFAVEMAYCAEPLVSQIQGLMNGMETLMQDLKKADENKAALDKEEKALIQTGELIKEAEKRLKQDYGQFENDMKTSNEIAARHNAEKNKSNDPAWIDSYNIEADRHNKNYVEPLKERLVTLQQRRRVIKERREGLNKAVTEWALMKKENNAKLNELYARYKYSINTINSLNKMHSGQMLIQKAGASEDCANIPGVEVLEKRLDGAAERAHRCLQKIWDGSR